MYTYVTAKQEKIEIEEIEIPEKLNMKDLFKVNLPRDTDSYLKGNGEGVWAISDEKGKEIAFNENSTSEKFLVRILNQPYYYEGLNYGDYVLVESRGEYRPVAILSELESKYNKITDKELEDLKLIIAAYGF